jgi:predicted RNA-binding protein with PUA-like domain
LKCLLIILSVSAQNPKAAYYDPKDTDPSNPKWSVVHVEFRRKFKEPITLKELREYAIKGGGLENMQMLKQSRLSVSAVTKDEWDFLMSTIEERVRSKGSSS